MLVERNINTTSECQVEQSVTQQIFQAKLLGNDVTGESPKIALRQGNFPNSEKQSTCEGTVFSILL